MLLIGPLLLLNRFIVSFIFAKIIEVLFRNVVAFKQVSFYWSDFQYFMALSHGAQDGQKFMGVVSGFISRRSQVKVAMICYSNRNHDGVLF